jgi:hypothetical protein
VRHASNNLFSPTADGGRARKVLHRAVEQPLSYTAWRGNPLALITFVRAKA